MARESELRRVEVGFAGGQAMAMRVSDDAYERLRRAVQDGGRWYELETVDGVVGLDLSQVVFVKLDTGEHRVGFSGI
jgi:hypothetical protein